jgi:hypothetical protein
MCEEHLPDAPRRQLAARVSHDAHAEDCDVDLIAVDFGHAPDGALRNAPLAEDAIDARDDLRSMGERHGARVELLEVAEAEVHGRLSELTRACGGARRSPGPLLAGRSLRRFAFEVSVVT